MKSVFRVLLFASLSVAWAQVIPTGSSVLPEIPDDQVLAVFDDGVKFTMHEFRALCTVMNPQMQQSALQNRKDWINQYALFRKLAQIAEKEKLDQMTPTKEALEFNRMLVLSQVAMTANMNTGIVEGADVVKQYEATKSNYQQVKVKVIYISFIPPALAKSGEKGLTEAQAEAKAKKLAADIRAGADFVKLVKENSDDETSKAKDGDFGVLRPTDKIPDAISEVVFKLKQGEISDPVRQPNGFYILKAEEISHRPLSEVRDEVYQQVKMEMHKKWLDQTRASVKVKLESDAFFNPKPAAAAAPAAK